MGDKAYPCLSYFVMMLCSDKSRVAVYSTSLHASGLELRRRIYSLIILNFFATLMLAFKIGNFKYIHINTKSVMNYGKF